MLRNIFFMQRVFYFLLLFHSGCSFADGPLMLFMKVKINFVDNKEQVKYIAMPDYSFDMTLMMDESYVFKTITATGYDDQVEFYNQRVRFNRPGEPIVGLFDIERIPINKIKKIAVLETHAQRGGVGILNKLNESDEAWINSTPLRAIHVSTFFTVLTIYQFAQNPALNEKILDFIVRSQAIKSHEENAKFLSDLDGFAGEKIVIVAES